MIISKILALLSFVFVISGCNIKSEMNPLDNFEGKQEASIKGTFIQLSNDTILNDPRDIWVRGNHLFLQDNLDGSAFSILDLTSKKLIQRFVRSGSDSTTFNISAVNMNILPNNLELTLFQANPPMRIFKYNIDSLLKFDISYSPRFQYQFPDKIFFKDIALLNDSIVLGQMGISDIDENLFGLFNMRNNELTTGIKLSPNSNLSSEKYLSKKYIPWTRTIMQGKFCQNPNDTKSFAFFSEKGSVVEFFKVTEQNGFETIKNWIHYLPSFDVLDHGNNFLSPVLNAECRYGFTSVTATDSKVYALYNGKLVKSTSVDNLLSQTVLVYSWNGDPLKVVKLDSPCYAIAIDPNNPEIMYALRAYKSPGIYKYILP